MEPTQTSPVRKLACRRCYRHKLRCIRIAGDAKCARCSRMKVLCEDRLEKSMGRPRGSRLVESSERSQQRRHSVATLDIQEGDVAYSAHGARQRRQTQVLSDLNGIALDTTMKNMTTIAPENADLGLYTGGPVIAGHLAYSNQLHGLAYTDSSAVTSLHSDDTASVWDFAGQETMSLIEPPLMTDGTSNEYWPVQQQSYQPNTSQADDLKFPIPMLPNLEFDYGSRLTYAEITKYEILERLSDLQKFTTHAQQFQLNSDPLKDLDLEGYPFTDQIEPEALFATPIRSKFGSDVHSESNVGNSAMQHNTKRIFAAAHLFIGTLRQLTDFWQYSVTNVHSTTRISPGHTHYPTSSRSLSDHEPNQILVADSATNLLAMSCYQRFLHLFTNIAKSLVSLVNRQGRSPTRPRQDGHRVPNHGWTTNRAVERLSPENNQLLQLVICLETGLHRNVQAYLAASGLYQDSRTNGEDEKWQKPVTTASSSVSEADLMSTINGSFEKFLRGLSQSRKELRTLLAVFESNG